MERPYILHMLTPGPYMSPFDVNMAADAGYDLVVPYAHVGPEAVAGLTQDAIFSRGPKGVARTGLFIGGRDALVASDMLASARKAMVPPFVVSVMADPSGAYTTAAALVAVAEAQLREGFGGAKLADQRVAILGGTGPVGRIAAVLAAREGATVTIASHRGASNAQAAADETGQRFGCSLQGAGFGSADELGALLADTDIVLATAAAGVQVVNEAQRKAAPRLKVAADVNAVPPEGIAGVGVMDNGKVLEGGARAVGALAVGNVKYQVQHRLLKRMRETEKPVFLDFADAYTLARELLQAPAK
jgi:methylene-tetrahydromethanopterin dehydrogenase